MRLVTWLIILLAIGTQAFAQQHIKQEIRNMDKDFRSFKYEQVIKKGNFLLSDPYVTKQDSLQIYKYMLTAAYALADTTKAKNIIKQILKCDPEFALSLKDTSPKIIEFYNHVKNQIQHHQPVIPAPFGQTNKRLFNKKLFRPLPIKSAVFSVLLPGSGHLNQRFIKKGLEFTTVSVGLLSSMAYTIVQTNKRRNAYMAARQNADFDRLYNEYNKMYKIRNVLIGAFVVWDLYAFFDLQRQWQLSLQVHPLSNALTIGIEKRW